MRMCITKRCNEALNPSVAASLAAKAASNSAFLATLNWNGSARLARMRSTSFELSGASYCKLDTKQEDLIRNCQVSLQERVAVPVETEGLHYQTLTLRTTSRLVSAPPVQIDLTPYETRGHMWVAKCGSNYSPWAQRHRSIWLIPVCGYQ